MTHPLPDQHGRRPCPSLTLPAVPDGGRVLLNPLPIARHASAVRLEVLRPRPAGDPPLSLWALLDVACQCCGADVSSHVLEAYRQARADAIKRAAELADS